MKLTTPVTIPKSSTPIELGTPFFCLGSCFAERVADKLSRHLFPTVSNPFGIMYNPISLGQALQSKHHPGGIFLHERNWRSLDTHSCLAASTPQAALETINRAVEQKNQALRSSQVIILTLGTALVFQELNTGRIAANCHRLPQRHFSRRRLTPTETFEALSAPLGNWLDEDPARQVIVTVSPVRHLKDGAVENSRSKAVLLLACDMLAKAHNRLSYFPAYEVFLDELRSYRFYKEDMIHPTEQSVDFVWERFLEAYLKPSEEPALALLSKVLDAREHRLGESSETRKFSAAALSKIHKLEAASPQLKLDPLREYFQRLGEPSSARG